MTQPTSKPRIFQVTCWKCKRPFHVSPSKGPDAEGEVEIAMTCQYADCRETLIVKVPKREAEAGHMLRSAPGSKESA
jgi:hypothetical protein